MEVKIGPCSAHYWRHYNNNNFFCEEVGVCSDTNRRYNRCGGCGYEPLDFSAYNCPRCHRVDGPGSLWACEQIQCPTCRGTKRVLLVLKPMAFSFGRRLKIWLPATESNLNQYLPQQTLSSSTEQPNLEQLVTYLQEHMTPQEPMYWYAGPGVEKAQLTEDQIIDEIKKEPSAKHWLYVEEKWEPIEKYKPYSRYVSSAPNRPKTKSQTSSSQKKDDENLSVSEHILYAIQHPNSKRKGDLLLYQGTDKQQKNIAPKTLIRYIQNNPNGKHKIFISGERIKGVWVENEWRNAKTLPALDSIFDNHDNQKSQRSSAPKERTHNSKPSPKSSIPKMVKPNDFPEMMKIYSRFRYMTTVLSLDSIPLMYKSQAENVSYEIQDFLRKWKRYGLDWNDSEQKELTELFALFEQLPEEVSVKLEKSVQKIVKIIEDFEKKNL